MYIMAQMQTQLGRVTFHGRFARQVRLGDGVRVCLDLVHNPRPERFANDLAGLFRRTNGRVQRLVDLHLGREQLPVGLDPLVDPGHQLDGVLVAVLDDGEELCTTKKPYKK